MNEKQVGEGALWGGKTNGVAPQDRSASSIESSTGECMLRKVRPGDPHKEIFPKKEGEKHTLGIHNKRRNRKLGKR